MLTQHEEYGVDKTSQFKPETSSIQYITIVKVMDHDGILHSPQDRLRHSLSLY